jgi:hypothetical protein
MKQQDENYASGREPAEGARDIPPDTGTQQSRGSNAESEREGDREGRQGDAGKAARAGDARGRETTQRSEDSQADGDDVV